MPQFGRRKLVATAILPSTIVGSLFFNPVIAAEVSHGELAAIVPSRSLGKRSGRRQDPTLKTQVGRWRDFSRFSNVPSGMSTSSFNQRST